MADQTLEAAHQPTEAQAAPAHDTHAGGAHRVPVWILAATLAALLLLTLITVAVTRTPALDFGRAGNLWIAMIIATIKASLVVLYFMHVRYERPIVGLILLGSLFFVLLFIGAALHDTHEYQPAIDEWRAVDPNSRYAPALQAR